MPIIRNIKDDASHPCDCVCDDASHLTVWRKMYL